MFSLKNKTKWSRQVPELKLVFDPYIQMIFWVFIVAHPEEQNAAQTSLLPSSCLVTQPKHWTVVLLGIFHLIAPLTSDKVTNRHF